MRGYFITLEGGEGAGKSSALEFIANYLQQSNINFIITREPGGTAVAEKIRQIILAHSTEAIAPDTELLLYFASRAQHLKQTILPALARGTWVLCDRFTDATYAYQGAGRGLAEEKIATLENLVQGELRPDYTLLFDVRVNLGFRRISGRNNLDRLEVEQEAFYDRVRNCYLKRAAREPQRFYIIDANKTQAEVTAQLTEILTQIVSSGC